MSCKYNQILRSLTPFLEVNNYYSYGGKKVSNAHRYKRANVLKQAFKFLRDSKYKLNNVNLFKERHFILLFNSWILKDLSASTIQYRASVLRVFANDWMKKKGMIKPVLSYSKTNPDRVKRIVAAKTSKCWSDNDVNPREIINEIEKYDPRVAIQLELQLTFMLRKKESFLLNPNQADCGELLLIEKGTKGGKKRIVDMVSADKKELIHRAKLMNNNKSSSMIPPNKSLKQWETRYAYVLKKFGINHKELGVTSHGLRHEGANNLYEEITGEKSSVRGGIICEDKKNIDALARDIISRELGHARRSITSSYTG